jgi:pimeloyl-ACP methyl ester carboxylesterase
MSKENSMNPEVAYGGSTLPSGIRSRMVPGINGLTIHVLEAGFERAGRPCVLLLHGFPELAYSWRKIILPLAAAGFHVIAPDQRGYGRTTGWDPAYDGDLASFRFLNLVRDMLGLVHALGHAQIEAVAGHDFGSSIAAWSALLRPDIFKRCVLMSAPFAGPPSLPPLEPVAAPAPTIHDELGALSPPRKHYHSYYSTREADANMRDCPQGVHAFLRAYYHHKSADWVANKPHKLTGWTATELAKLPAYYVMPHGLGMAETVAAEMPSQAEIAANQWLTEDELAVYAGEYVRNGFQGGLQWYRCRTVGRFNAELEVFSGRTIDVPSMFISGKSDWGVYQTPDAFEAMPTKACTRMTARHLIEGAGHWVQQEQPEAVSRLLLGFLNEKDP